MNKTKAIPFFVLALSAQLCAEPQNDTQPQNAVPSAAQEAPKLSSGEVKSLVAFTGKITRNRVRLRSQPSLEAPILRELERDECLVVNGIADDFYAVRPPQHMKAYVYRTYVLDGQIEGNNVNVRLEPDTSAPVVAQLNQGDAITGMVCPFNSKWYEIELPDSVRFFVAKEFVNRIGDAMVYEDIEKRKNLIEAQFVQINGAMIEELKRPFKEIQLAPLAAQLHQIINQNEDLPNYTARAQSMLQKMQEAYLQKSMATMQTSFPEAASLNKPQAQEPALSAQADGTEETPSPTDNKKAVSAQPHDQVFAVSATNLTFKQQEERRLQAALENGEAQSAKDFYAQEAKRAMKVKGLVKPFMRNVKNAPGDFQLVNAATNVPIAFLYSTQVNLLDNVNREVTIVCVERPNNDYAFPAYFVLSVEK